jgi:hypothetical protein
VEKGGIEYQRRIANLNNETVSHLLWECRWVYGVLENVLNRLTGDNNGIVNKNNSFGGWELERRYDRELTVIILHFVKYLIYVCRNRRTVLTFAYVMYELGKLINNMGRRDRWRAGVVNLGDILKGVYTI